MNFPRALFAIATYRTCLEPTRAFRCCNISQPSQFMPAFSFGTSTAEHSEHASLQSTFGGASNGTSGMFSFKMTPMQPTLHLDNIQGDGLFALKTSASTIAPSKAPCNKFQTTSSFSFLPQATSIPSAELQLPSSYSSCDFDEQQKPDQHDDQSENEESETTNGVAMAQAATEAAGQHVEAESETAEVTKNIDEITMPVQKNTKPPPAPRPETTPTNQLQKTSVPPPAKAAIIKLSKSSGAKQPASASGTKRDFGVAVPNRNEGLPMPKKAALAFRGTVPNPTLQTQQQAATQEVSEKRRPKVSLKAPEVSPRLVATTTASSETPATNRKRPQSFLDGSLPFAQPLKEAKTQMNFGQESAARGQKEAGDPADYSDEADDGPAFSKSRDLNSHDWTERIKKMLETTAETKECFEQVMLDCKSATEDVDELSLRVSEVTAEIAFMAGPHSSYILGNHIEEFESMLKQLESSGREISHDASTTQASEQYNSTDQVLGVTGNA